MAPDETLADPAFLQFLDMVWQKGGIPALALVAVFALVWKYGWPKFGASYSNPPPAPNAVVEAMTALRDEVADMREVQDERLERIEGDLRILLDRTPRK